MNERNRATTERLIAGSIRCECECQRAGCGNSFVIAIDDYEAVRAEGRRFIVAPNHQGDGELVVSVAAAYSVIEKVGDQGQVALALDPR